MATSIGNLFGQIQAVLPDVTALEQPLGDDGLEKSVSVDTGSHKIPVLFDTPVAVEASAKASAQIFAKGKVPDSPFGAMPLKIADDQRYVAFNAGGTLTASANLSATPGVLTVSATASTKTSFSYAHYLALPATTKRLDALLALGASSTLPQLADVTKLRAGEVLDFSGLLNVDLGLQAKVGSQADVQDDLRNVVTILSSVGGSGISVPFKLHVGFTASASLGFSLYESMKLTVAAAATTKPDFVRMRLEREHRTRIAFGVAVDTTISYDAQAGAQALIDKAFALIPKTKAIGALQQVQKAANLASTNFEGFKAAITDEAATIVGRLLNDTHWKDAVAKSDAVQKLIDAATAIVAAYDKVDAKVKSIIEEVIGRLNDLGLLKVKEVLAKVAALNTSDITDKLPAQAKEVVHWIEVLTGQDIEELIVSGNIEKELARAVSGAKQILAFLDGGLKNDALKKLHDILDQTGATGLVKWLRANATSLASLQSAVDTAVSDWVKRIVGKELNQLSADDVQKIQDFATRLDKLLSAPETLKNKLVAATQKLKGTIGFSVAAEISRVSEWSAIVDVEINPKSGDAVSAATRLQHGKFGDFLKELNSVDTKQFVIHEILLTSRRTRTSASTTIASFLGFALKDNEIAVDEKTISVRVDDSGNIFRDAMYYGGVTVQRSLNDSIAESSAWVRMPATGSGTDVSAPYDSSTPSLRLTYSREDDDANNNTRNSIRRLLGELSFGSAIAAVPNDPQTRFSLQIEFGPEAVKALKANDTETEWNTDVLKAANRWFSDVGTDSPEASVMANVVLNPEFKSRWFKQPVPDNDFFAADAAQKFGPRLLGPNRLFKVEFRGLGNLMESRGGSFKHFVAFDPNEASSKQPDVLLHCSRTSSDLFRTGQTSATPPMFNFWFVVGRLFRLDPDVFKTARMVATIRSRQKATDPWPEPQIFAMSSVSTEELPAVFKA
ncbi:MAG TPA: hypothetical protein VII75_02065 [Thermoanaerobaculia bacterium]